MEARSNHLLGGFDDLAPGLDQQVVAGGRGDFGMFAQDPYRVYAETADVVPCGVVDELVINKAFVFHYKRARSPGRNLPSSVAQPGKRTNTFRCKGGCLPGARRPVMVADAAEKPVSHVAGRRRRLSRYRRHLLKLLGRREPAVDAAPTDQIAADAHIAAGDRLRDIGDCSGAAQAYALALALVPRRTDIRVQLGNMLKDSGRLADAETAYRAALVDAAADAEIHLQLGHVFKLQGRRGEALAAYRRAADLDPTLTA